MIDKVVVFGVRRAGTRIPVGDIRQSIGRAGRDYVRPGEAVVIVPPEDEDYAWSCMDGQLPGVVSEMSSIEAVAFGVLPWIGTSVYDASTFDAWYARTLAFAQGKSLEWGGVHEYLLSNGCIDGKCSLTAFGRISVRMYFPPSRLLMMREKYLEVMECGENPDEVFPLSYILAYDQMHLADAEGWKIASYKSSVFSEGYVFSHGELMHGYALKCLLSWQDPAPGWIRHTVSQLRGDFPRQMSALVAIAEDSGADRDVVDRLRISGIMCEKKCDSESARLIMEFDERIGRRGAAELLSLGIGTIGDYYRMKQTVLDEGSPALKKSLGAHGLLPEYVAFLDTSEADR